MGENERHVLIMCWLKMDHRNIFYRDYRNRDSKIQNLNCSVDLVRRTGLVRSALPSVGLCSWKIAKGNNICILIMIIHQVEFHKLSANNCWKNDVTICQIWLVNETFQVFFISCSLLVLSAQSCLVIIINFSVFCWGKRRIWWLMINES